MKSVMIVSFIILNLLWIFCFQAVANKQQFCGNYADTAVEQYKLGKQHNLPGIVPPAWSNDRNGHFNWCMVVPENFANSENAKRQAYLDKNIPKAAPTNKTVTGVTVGHMIKALDMGEIAGIAIAQGNQSYLGCFKDQENRDLTGFSFHAPNMTKELCMTTCQQKGFQYAGLQYSSYCFCGNSYGNLGKANNCNMPCAGNKSEICGGSWANSVYRIGQSSGKAVQNTNKKFILSKRASMKSFSPGFNKIGKLEKVAPPKGKPTRLTAYKRTGDPDISGFLIQLEWRWDDKKIPSGFAIYRKKLDGQGQYKFLTNVAGNKSSYLDRQIAAPHNDKDAYCYVVKAYNIPFVTSKFGINRVESSPSNKSCTTYSRFAPPLNDQDNDGLPDIWDWCPNDHKGSNITRVEGCPDGDEDGYADFIQVTGIPDKYHDQCPPGFSKDGYGPLRDPKWSRLGLRSYDPLPGCPVKYEIRFMGLEVLNEPADCTDPNQPARSLGCDKVVGIGNEYNQQNEVINGKQLPPGFEPYLIFGFIHGVSTEGGELHDWTKKWCCGEGLQVGRYSIPNLPTRVKPEGVEPDLDFRGAEDPAIDRKIRREGYIIFPEQPLMRDNFFQAINRKSGLLFTSSLFERDFDMKYTPKKSEDTVSGMLKKLTGPMQTFVQCGISMDPSCAGTLAKTFAGVVHGSMGDYFGTDRPNDVTVHDRDDVFGIAGMSLPSAGAEWLTRKNGVYGFFFDYPPETEDGRDFDVTYTGSYVPPPKPWSPVCKIANMVARAKFCLVRKGVDTASIKDLCKPYSHQETFIDK